MHADTARSKRKAAGSMGVVALFVLSGLAGITGLVAMAPEAEAKGLAPPSPPGALDVLTPNVGALPGAPEAVTVKVRNPHSGNEELAIYQFVVSINDTVSNPSPITVFEAGQSRISLKDWTITPTNDCNGPDLANERPCKGLVFMADNEDALLYPGGEVEFEIHLEINDQVRECTYLGDVDHGAETPALRIIGLHNFDSPGSSPPQPHITGKTGENEDAYFVKVIADDGGSPAILDAEVQLANGRSIVPTFYVDEDHNGHIDHVYIQFDKELDPATLDVRDFEVGRARPDEYAVLEAEIIDPVYFDDERIDGGARPREEPAIPAGTGDGFEFCPNNSMVKLKFNEEDHYDTGETPNLKFKRKSAPSREDPRIKLVLTGYGGARVASSPIIIPADRAQPVLVAATIKLDEEDDRKNVDVLVTLSEVVGRTGAPCNVRAPPQIGGLQVDDLMWSNNVPGSQQFRPISVEEAAISTEETASWFWLHFDRLSTDLAPFDWDDLEYRFEDSGSFNMIEEQPVPDRIRVDPRSNICDENGNKVYDARGPEFEDHHEPLAPPTIVGVDGNIGFDKVTVEFTVPVNITADLEPHDIFSVGGGRGTAAGVVGIEHEECSEIAIVQLDGPLQPKDVTGDPTFLRLDPGKVNVCNADDWTFRAQDKEIVDVTPPSILYALTRDLDGNGEVDAYEIWFSEIIVDTSFEEGNPGQDKVILDVFQHNAYERKDVGPPNDDRMTIGFKPVSPEDGYGTHRLPQLNAIQKNVTSLWKGLVKDHAYNKDIDGGNWMENITDDDLQELDGAPPRIMVAESLDRDSNGLLDAYRLTFSEPVKDESFDQDHWFIGPDGVYNVTGISEDRDYDRFPNDAVMILEFEEKTIDPLYPIGDTGVPLDPPQLTYAAPPGEGLEDLADLPEDLGGPNRMLNFGADKINEIDAAPPVLMSVLGCEGTDDIQIFMSEGTVSKDSNDSPPRKLNTNDFIYRNAEGSASGFIEDTAKHTQGDRVIIAKTSGIISAEDMGNDRFHVVQDPKESPPKGNGIVEEVKGALHAQVDHEVSLGRAKDIVAPEAIDDLDFQESDVFAAGLEMEFTVPHDDGCLVLNDDGSKFEPAVVDYVIRFNTTQMSPQGFDKGEALDPDLVQFTWYDPVKEQNFTKDPAELVDEHGVRENETLRVTATGLLPDTDYWLGIAPVDRLGNEGEPSRILQFRTTIDLTAPDVPDDFGIRSPTHPEGVPTKDPAPQFEWDEAFDEESRHVYYVYALSKNDGYVPNIQQDPEIFDQQLEFTAERVSEFTNRAATGLAPEKWYDDPAEWYFHLAACSGGGCEPAGSYRFLVDAPVNRTEMHEANAQVTTTVTYDELAGDFIVSWEFPPEGQLPCTPAGSQIWRRDAEDTEFRHLATFGSNDRTFKEAQFVDPDSGSADRRESRYLVTFYCPDQVVSVWDGDAFQGELVEGAGLFPSDRSPPGEDYEGSTATIKKAPFRVPMWVWIVLAVLGLAVLAGVVAFFALRRGGEAELWEEGELDEAELSAFGSLDEAPPGEEPAAGQKDAFGGPAQEAGDKDQGGKAPGASKGGPGGKAQAPGSKTPGQPDAKGPGAGTPGGPGSGGIRSKNPRN